MSIIFDNYINCRFLDKDGEIKFASIYKIKSEEFAAPDKSSLSLSNVGAEPRSKEFVDNKWRNPRKQSKTIVR